MIWTWLGALIVGVSLGLLGSGGSILTVPVLVYLAGEPEKLAITSSLAIVAAISAAGALTFARRGEIAWRSVTLFGLPGMAGAALGARLAHWLPAGMPLLIFAAVMLWAAKGMLQPESVVDAGGASPRAAPRWRLASDGALVGFVAHLIANSSQWRRLDPLLMIAFIVIGIAGSLAGQKLGAGLPQRALRGLFSLVLFAIAGFILWQQSPAVLQSLQSHGE